MLDNDDDDDDKNCQINFKHLTNMIVQLVSNLIFYFN